jgi:Cof subfamily protein (haloacid dehalogenase superfamily)
VIDIIAVDLDGTLLSSDSRTVSASNRDALSSAHKDGTIVTIATGRTMQLTEHIIDSLAHIDYLIAAGGAAVYEVKNSGFDIGYAKERSSYVRIDDRTADFDTELPTKIYNIIDKHHALVDVYANDGQFIQRDKKEMHVAMRDKIIDNLFDKLTIVDDLHDVLTSPGVQKFIFHQVPRDAYETILTELKNLGGLMITSSYGGLIEVTSERATKSNALRFLAKKTGSDMAKVIAVGDSDNDIDMIEAAGIGFATGNAIDEVKEVAQFTVTTNDNSAVAEAIKIAKGIL